MAIALSIAYTVTPLVDNVVIQATRQVSAGVNFMPRSAYKTLAVLATAAASPANVLSAYNALYGVLISGKKIFIRVVPITAAGVAGPPQDFTQLVT